MDKNSTNDKKLLKYWKSIQEYENETNFDEKKKNEFLQGILNEFNPDNLPPVSRRKFLALVGASAAFVSTSCTDYRDKGKIVPYNKKPENVELGTANYYASTSDEGLGVLVKTREGRPIKVNGNPDHPVNKGKTTNHTQAGIMDLYNPERLRYPLRKSQEELLLYKDEYERKEWKDINKEIIKSLETATSTGREIAFVTKAVLSPSLNKLFGEFKEKYPTTKIYSYELFNENNRYSAWEKCYGSYSFPTLKMEQAKTILALEADFLGTDGNAFEYIRKFAETRNAEDLDNFSRLYSVEGAMTLTGSNADYRLRLDPVMQYEFILSLINEIYYNKWVKNVFNFEGEVVNVFSGHKLKDFAEKNDLDYNILSHLVNDLIENRGRSLVYAGSSLPEDIHIAVNFLNEFLGNNKLYNHAAMHTEGELSSTEDFRNLVSDLNSGKIDLLIHFDSNPVYHLSDELGYAEAMKKAGMIISMTGTKNESIENSTFLLPVNHYLESWGDSQIRSGVYSLRQPVVETLYDTIQKEALVLGWVEGNPENINNNNYHNYLRDYWQNNIYPILGLSTSFKQFWYEALHDGIVQENNKDVAGIEFNVQAINSINPPPKTDGFTVILQKSYAVGDGSHADNGWLQELPHPISKIVWDNYAAMSPVTAKKLGFNMNDLIEIRVGERKITMPVVPQPGTAESVINIELGYGRTAAGIIGSDVGFDAGKLMSIAPVFSDWIIPGAQISKKEGVYKCVSTQEHHSLDDKFTKDIQKIRDIIQEGTVDEYKNHPNFLDKHKHEIFSITENKVYTGLKWGMSIDLNKCIGCNQCVTSCNVENNIVVVGKDQTSRGREMQWMRIDRYYSGTPDEPEVSLQPMLCQHCDNAPCENVCPVAATNHSPDGLNQMVYNRCVGTRYCSNNCPFKVRRFNFYDYRDHLADAFQYEDSLKLLHNPEVTVRSRGVMEKCTFCIQRIAEGKENATNSGTKLKGSQITTACQEACPAGAITFGDLNDKESEVAKKSSHELGYHVLEILNVKPNVTYLAKLRNKFSEEV